MFTVTNTGTGNMSAATTYEIKRNGTYENGGSLQLNAGASQSFTVNNYNDLVTLQVFETGDNPFNLSAWALSDCGSAINFGGSAPALAITDQQPWLDQDLEVIIGAYDPNDKFAWPFGSGEAHSIDRLDELEYRIRFQNTGNDTAFTVVLVDTLSSFLDPATLRITGYSHQYLYELNGNLLTVTFPDIQLPDSSTNLDGSIGYIRFAVKQTEGNPANYQINNFADIYFDFNPPIRTNTAVRTIGELELEVATASAGKIVAYPNPANDRIAFLLPDTWNSATYSIQITDMAGRVVLQKNCSGNNPQLSVADVAPGFYTVLFQGKKLPTAQLPVIIVH
jgi:hypothetical protein